MKHPLTATFCLVGVVAFASCKPDASSDSTSTAAYSVLTIDSVDAVKQRFNADADKPRFLTILSPT